jgi:DNA ligase-associated metallophosphoesterase
VTRNDPARVMPPAQLAFLQPATHATGADGVLVVSAGGEAVELHAQRALYWPRGRTLFVADPHLGKGASFRAAGVPLPRGATAGDLARLSALLASTGAATLCVLGDFLHAAAGRVAALDRAFVAWREAHASLEVVLVRGNHDLHAGDPPEAWRVRVVAEPHALPPFLACHAPREPRTGYALCGHVHPGVRVSGRAGDSARLPCFVLGRRRALLPAFGRLTGLAIVAPAPDESVVAIAGNSLFRLPGA